MNPDDDLWLLCIIEGKTKVFPIDIEGPLWCNPKFMVGSLKEKIQEKQKDVDAISLVLWNSGRCVLLKVHNLRLYGLLVSFQPPEGILAPINVILKSTLPRCVVSARESREELEPVDSILTIFPDQPPLDCLHIIIRKLDTGE